MKVSIITVCLNSRQTIAQTIESVLNQTYKNIEYIVIDGKSTDGTVDVIESYAPLFGPRLKWISERDNGLYDAMNKGVSMSTGDIVGILNSDDLYYDNRVIEKVVSTFSSTHCDVLYSDVEYFKEENGKYKIVRKWIAGSGNVRLGWIPCHLGVFVKREIYEKIGKYDTRYSIAADYDFLFRVFADNEFRISYLNSYTVRMRNGGKSTGSMKNILKGNIEVYKSLKAKKVNLALVVLFIRILRRLPHFFV